MIIAVIGDYDIQQYQDLLQRVRTAYPEDQVLDLSRHNKSWKKNLEARFEDICIAHLVIIGFGWRYKIDAKRDVTHAQYLGRECFIDREGRFLSFPQYATEI